LVKWNALSLQQKNLKRQKQNEHDRNIATQPTVTKKADEDTHDTDEFQKNSHAYRARTVRA